MTTEPTLQVGIGSAFIPVITLAITLGGLLIGRGRNHGQESTKLNQHDEDIKEFKASFQEQQEAVTMLVTTVGHLTRQVEVLTNQIQSQREQQARMEGREEGRTEATTRDSGRRTRRDLIGS